jgi:hypothetical protein
MWQINQAQLHEDIWEPIVTTLIGRAESSAAFRGEIENATRDGTVSLSKDSLTGARHWLEALTPSVVESGTSARRHFCPPELSLLGIGWVARTMGEELGIDFLLTPARREAICRLCFLEPTALDKVLDWMLPMYAGVVRQGTGAGVYGRFLHFAKWPDMGDLLS